MTSCLLEVGEPDATSGKAVVSIQGHTARSIATAKEMIGRILYMVCVWAFLSPKGCAPAPGRTCWTPVRRNGPRTARNGKGDVDGVAVFAPWPTNVTTVPLQL